MDYYGLWSRFNTYYIFLHLLSPWLAMKIVCFMIHEIIIENIEKKMNLLLTSASLDLNEANLNLYAERMKVIMSQLPQKWVPNAKNTNDFRALHSMNNMHKI